MSIKATDILEFELTAMDLAAANKIDNKEDLEKCSQILHEAIENAMEDYADDFEIEDYEPQY